MTNPGRTISTDLSHAGFRTTRLRRSFAALSAAFILAIVLVVIVGVVAIYGLSGARAYVHGESQWTKAQKQAVIALFDYAATGQRARFEDFRDALAVNHGDRRARLALSQDEPDYEAAREGFLAGRNRPEDIDLMMGLFVAGRSLPLFADAVEAWTEADRLIDRLEAEAQVLHRQVERFGPGSPAVLEHLDEIERVDRDLTRQEDRFSHAMGQISHRLTKYFSIAILVFAMGMIGAVLLLAWYLLRTGENKDSALVASEQRYRALVDQPEVGMWQVDPDGRIEFLNPAMRMLLGLDADEDVDGQSIDHFLEQSQQERVRDNRAARIQGRHEAMEVTLEPRRGASRTTLVHGAPIRIDKTVIGHVGTCVDISARKQAERELRHQALHDALTGLPNRKLFMDRLEMALRRARRTGQNVAILFLDLDRFKIVNDGLGHPAGDELLRQAAKRLLASIRERDSLARFGGDEFGIILETIERIEDATEPARRIIQSFERAFEVDGVEARIGTSIGIVVSEGGTSAPQELLRHADIAMYSAKRDGGGTFHVYDPEHDEFQQSRLGFESQLWRAVERNELCLYYQPIIELASNRVESLEALVRWNHPEKGLLTPGHFIGVAEETGAIASIGRWVARQACMDLVEMQARLGDRAPCAIAINVSDAEFRLADPTDHLRASCRTSGAAPSAIRVEVTESMLTRRPDHLRALKLQGHDIVIDDFGMGYASLDQLRHVPFGTIKIDRSFIAGFQQSVVDLSIIEAIAHVGERLGVRVVAEGIEHPEQVAPLRELGCGFGQGFHFSHPGPLSEIMDTIQADPAG